MTSFVKERFLESGNASEWESGFPRFSLLPYSRLNNHFPKDVCVLIPGTYEYVISCSRRNLADVSKCKILTSGDYFSLSMLISVSSQESF